MPQHDRPPEESPDAGRWYLEHTALLISTFKWALLGAAAGLCVGLGTRGFLWSLSASAGLVGRFSEGHFPAYWLLPIALPACVLLVRRLAPEATGHGTEAVITAVHERAGRIPWRVAPVKLLATVVTLAFGGSVGKEGPAAQIGAAITSAFASLLRLDDADRRRLVICGIGAGFAAVFGTPISGALFGVEVLYLGRIEYAVLFPCLIAGIVAHLVCGVTAPLPALQGGGAVPYSQPLMIGLVIAFGVAFGLAALLLIEAMRALELGLRRLGRSPYLMAACGGGALALLYATAGEMYAGLGTSTITAALTGTVQFTLLVAVLKIAATAITLETGGSGGIITPIFFIGATTGAALARAAGLPVGVFAAIGMISVLAAGANTPIAAAVMAMEMLPASLGVHAALAAVTAFLLVGHRSVYASQKLGLAKSAGLDVPLDVAISDLRPGDVRVRQGSLTHRVLERWGPGERGE